MFSTACRLFGLSYKTKVIIIKKYSFTHSFIDIHVDISQYYSKSPELRIVQKALLLLPEFTELSEQLQPQWKHPSEPFELAKPLFDEHIHALG
jgi:hypothetical protein